MDRKSYQHAHYFPKRKISLVSTNINGSFYLLVMTGAHYSIIPIVAQNLAQLGYDTVMLPGNLASNIALAGACFAVAIKTKRVNYKGVATSAGITAVLGFLNRLCMGLQYH